MDTRGKEILLNMCINAGMERIKHWSANQLKESHEEYEAYVKLLYGLNLKIHNETFLLHKTKP